jgi:hypothetical protein
VITKREYKKVQMINWIEIITLFDAAFAQNYFYTVSHRPTPHIHLFFVTIIKPYTFLGIVQ